MSRDRAAGDASASLDHHPRRRCPHAGFDVSRHVPAAHRGVPAGRDPLLRRRADDERHGNRSHPEPNRGPDLVRRHEPPAAAVNAREWTLSTAVLAAEGENKPGTKTSSSCLARRLPPRNSYYVCTGKARQARHRNGKTCDSRYIPSRAIDDLVWEDLCELIR